MTPDRLSDRCIVAAARVHYDKDVATAYFVATVVDAVLAEVAAWCDGLAARAWDDAKRDAYELVADECRGEGA